MSDNANHLKQFVTIPHVHGHLRSVIWPTWKQGKLNQNFHQKLVYLNPITRTTVIYIFLILHSSNIWHTASYILLFSQQPATWSLIFHWNVFNSNYRILSLQIFSTNLQKYENKYKSVRCIKAAWAAKDCRCDGICGHVCCWCDRVLTRHTSIGDRCQANRDLLRI